MQRAPLVIALAALALSACGDRSTRLVDPATRHGTTSLFEMAPGLPGCTTSEQEVYDLIAQVFPAGNDRTAAEARFDNIVKLLERGTPSDSATAQAHTFTLIDFTLKKYHDGQLLEQTPPATLGDAVMGLVNGFLCFTGLPTVPGGALDPDGAIAIVDPSSDVTVVTGTRQTGVDFDPGAVTQTVLVTISRIEPWTPPGPLATLLDQYPPFYEYHMSPELPGFEIPVLVGVCPIIADQSVLDRVKLAHNVPDGAGGETVEIVEREDAPFLDCTVTQTGATSGFHLFDLASATLRPIVRAFLPAELHAATFGAGGVGGTVRSFSPFGVVDPEVMVDAASATTQRFPIGEPVPEPPAVRVHTFNQTPLPGIPVGFTVQAGGGTLAPAGGAVLTDADGLAALDSWTLGTTPGSNSLWATAEAPHTGAYVVPAPLVFSATANPPTQLRFRVQPTSATAGSVLAPPVAVEVLDDDDNVVHAATAPVAMTLGTAPTGATLSGTTTRGAAQGVATFADLFLTRLGSYTLVASSGALRPATSDPFGISAAAADRIVIVSGDSQVALEGTAVEDPPTVRVIDRYGNPVAGIRVEFLTASGGVDLSEEHLTDAAGTARVSAWVVVAGTNTMYATAYDNDRVVGTVVFTATGQTLQDILANCPPSSGSGDDLSRGFYFPNGGRNRISRLGQVTLFLSSNDQANAPTRYRIELTATSGAFGGPPVGTASAWVAFRGNTSENQPVNFVFGGGPVVPSGEPLVFALRVVSSDPDARGGVRFNTGPCGVGDSRCRASSCPVIETASTNPDIRLSQNFRRKGCGIVILGAP